MAIAAAAPAANKTTRQVNGGVIGDGQEIAGSQNEQRASCDGTQQQSTSTSRRRDRAALDQNLANEPSTRRAEGASDGKFALAAERGDEKQVGEIRARDCEHEADGGLKQHENGLDPCHKRAMPFDDASYRRESAFVVGYSARRRATMASRSSVACAMVTSGLSRPDDAKKSKVARLAVWDRPRWERAPPDPLRGSG